MLYPDGRIIIFAKAPVAGKVKTRLSPALSAAQCARLQQNLIEHTLKTCSAELLCPVELWCTHPQHHFFLSCSKRYDIKLHRQQGRDLGERMLDALTKTLQQARFAIIIGTDCPVLTQEQLKDVAKLFDSASSKATAEVVLTPAEDGGYVLIAASLAEAGIFSDISWGESNVLQQTRHQLQKTGIRHFEMPALWDIDRPEDLLRLAQLPIGKTLLDSVTS